MNALKIISPGPFTTVQDRGRFGFQQFGVPPCGMLDKGAGRLANLLAGNDPNAAVLEFTFMGARMEALDEFQLAVTGGDMGMTINGAACGNWASHRVRPGDMIQMGSVTRGCRAYLALAGGVDVPEVMGSRATYTGAAMGGYKGRMLASGDIIRRGQGADVDTPMQLPARWIPRYSEKIILRAVAGPQDGYFDKGLDTFFNSEFTVTDKANRMGYRLQGPIVSRKEGMPLSIISEPSLPGGVQIPEDGQPIILLAEQTVGGYAKIATVISPDLDRMAQAVPGNRVRFEVVTLEQAHGIYREEGMKFKEIEQADLGVKSLAAMGERFFHLPVFRERLEKYMLQILRKGVPYLQYICRPLY